MDVGVLDVGVFFNVSFVKIIAAEYYEIHKAVTV